MGLNVYDITSNLLVNGNAEKSSQEFPTYGWVEDISDGGSGAPYGAFKTYDQDGKTKKPKSGTYFFTPIYPDDENVLKYLISKIANARSYTKNNLPGLIPGGYTPGNVPANFTPPASIPEGMPSLPGLPKMNNPNLPGVPFQPPGISHLPGIPMLPGMSCMQNTKLLGLEFPQHIRDMLMPHPGVIPFIPPSVSLLIDIFKALFNEISKLGKKQADLVQVVDVSLFKNFIDAGAQTFSFSGCYRGDDTDKHKPNDSASIIIEPLDENGNHLIDPKSPPGQHYRVSYNSGQTKSFDWQTYILNDQKLPKGARKIKVILRVNKDSGHKHFGGGFDDLSLTMPVYKLPFTLSANTVTVGQTVKINPDADFNFSGITYESLNNCATVAADGTITGKNTGQAKIKIIDPIFKDVENIATLNVVAAAPQPTAPVFADIVYDRTFIAGNFVSFSALAEGNPSPTYQWQVSTNGGSTWVNLNESAPYNGVTSCQLTIGGIPATFNGYKYRCLASNSVGTTTSNAASLTLVNSPFSGGCGTETDPFIITTAEQLLLINKNVYNCFKLGADIDLAAYGANYNGGEGWTPINCCRGFDGNNKIISNLYINTFKDNIGFFGKPTGTVKNLGLVKVNIFGKKNVGGVVGNIENYGTNSTIINCYVTGSIAGESNVGGIVGFLNQRSRIEKCFTNATVSGTDNCGGLVGSIMSDYEKAFVSNCYATGEVRGDNNIGGVAGSVIRSQISNCYATGAVIGNNKTGGIVGSVNDNSIVTNCVALNPNVKCKGENAGRVAGLTENSTLPNNAAYEGMQNQAGNTTWNNIGLLTTDGADMSKDAINADGTLGSRFTATGSWTTANGKLPGLLGKTTDMPAHLKTGASLPDSPTTPSTPNDESLLMKIINFILKLFNLYKEKAQEK